METWSSTATKNTIALDGEVRVTVQEFAELSKIYNEDMDAWRQAVLSESPEVDPQELEQIVFLLVPSTVQFYAKKHNFWQGQIPKVEDMLRQEGAEELVAVFQNAPAFYVWDLLHNRPDSLLEYLQSLKRAINEGKRKLSKLQIEILLDLYALSIGGLAPATWIPSKVLGSQTPADWSAVSRALKRLEERGLIVRQYKKASTFRRTTTVRFTYLGSMVTKPIWDSLDADVRRFKRKWMAGQASWQK